MAVIDFLHPGPPYSSETMRLASMGGTESSVVQLAEALAARDHDVTVFNGVAEARDEFGVKWRPFRDVQSLYRCETGIAVATPKHLQGLDFKSSIVWLHNPTTTWRQIKRGHLGPLMRIKPTAVLLGKYHARHVPRWLPYRSRTVIRHGIAADFFRTEPLAAPPPPRAIFTSQPYRGLDWLLEVWEEIEARRPGAELHIFAPKGHQADENGSRTPVNGVVFRGNVSRSQLVHELHLARVQLIPGHPDETFCLAAAEATAAGVPVVTLGAGALCERVRDGINGFIARNDEAFVDWTAALLSDEILWRRTHLACLTDPYLKTWDKRALEWEKLFESFEEGAATARSSRDKMERV